MKPRTLIAAALLLAAPLAAPAAAPVPAGKTEGGPPFVLQVAPLAKLIDDTKAVAKAVAGDAAADQITQAINGKLGDKGFQGIDTKKPAAAFLYVPDKLDVAGKKPNEINPEEVARKFKGGLMIPVTKAEDFKEFFTRMTEDHVKFSPVDGKDGLFKVDNPKDPAPFPIRARFLAGYVYVGLNLSDDDMDAKALPAPESLINPKETAQVAVRVITDRYPPGLMKEAMESIDNAITELKKQAGGATGLGAAEMAITSYVKMARRYSEQLMKESSEMGYRLVVDTKDVAAGFEFYIVPKPGTSLAADVAARKPSTNKFAGIIAPDAAAAATLQLPLFAQEIKDILVGLIEEGQKQAKMNAPPPAQPLAEELLAGLARTVKTGEFDLAAALTGPDKDGHFTAVAAIAFEDAGKLDKLLRDGLKDAPKEVKDVVTLDAEKAGDVTIHKITPPEEPPPGAGKMFGAKEIYFAFGPKGIYAAFGTGAVDSLKKAIAAKPGPARPLDVMVNPKRLQAAVVALNGEEAGKAFTQATGTEDKLASVLFASVSGGAELRLRLGLSLKFLPRLWTTTTVRPAVAPPAQIIK